MHTKRRISAFKRLSRPQQIELVNALSGTAGAQVAWPESPRGDVTVLIWAAMQAYAGEKQFALLPCDTFNFSFKSSAGIVFRK